MPKIFKIRIALFLLRVARKYALDNPEIEFCLILIDFDVYRLVGRSGLTQVDVTESLSTFFPIILRLIAAIIFEIEFFADFLQ